MQIAQLIIQIFQYKKHFYLFTLSISIKFNTRSCTIRFIISTYERLVVNYVVCFGTEKALVGVLATNRAEKSTILADFLL